MVLNKILVEIKYDDAFPSTKCHQDIGGCGFHIVGCF
jgi:hypothetical protein